MKSMYHASLIRRHYQRGLVFLCLSLFVLTIGHASAATQSPTAASTTTPQEENFGSPQYATPAGLSSCFDYYTFGSVPVSLTPSLNSVSVGAPVVFSGTITNNNPYPIVNADVYIKIFRERDTSGAKDPNGPDVVDMMKAAGPITLKAGESQKISFSWHVPQDAQSGSYQAASYVVSSNRFELFGLVFTDDVTGSLTNFSVIGGQTGSVSFDKTSIKVNETPFFFAAYPPNVPATGDVAISGSVANTTDVPMKGTITWSLYSWDSLRPDALIDSATQEVKVHPHSTTAVTYVAHDAAHSVYYLVGTLKAGGSTSIVGIRFVRSDVNTPRINFAGITGYPAADSSKLFMCVHNTNDGEASDSSMTVSIVPTDPVERVVDAILGRSSTFSYTGVIPPQLVALAGPVKTMPSSFNVVARLYQHGALVDEATIPYACSALGAACGYSYTLMAIIGGIILLVILIALRFIFKRRRQSTITP